MTLFVFNPEHDLALASGLSNFTAPHAGRRLRADLGYLPALWAGPDDCVLVENVEQARRAYGRLRARVGGAPRRFVDKSQLSRLDIDRVEPWGWDMALHGSLTRYGVAPEACATVAEITAVREYSHRRYAAEVLQRLDWPAPLEATTLEAVEAFSRGAITEKAFWDEISIEFGSPIPWRDGLVGRFYKTAYIPGVSEVIRDLRGAGKRVVAGSNLIPSFLEVNRANHRYDVFDKAYISCEMHLAKPDAAFYQEILRKEGYPPEEAFFTDDLEKNVEAARAVGLEAFRFTDTDALRKRLDALGVWEDCR